MFLSGQTIRGGSAARISIHVKRGGGPFAQKEFDIHRVAKTAHPLMEKYGIDAVPFEHPDMEKWRDNFTGVQCHHKPSNFIFTGAVDDIWINSKTNCTWWIIKPPSKDGDVGIDAEWQEDTRQMEIYQWLLRQNGFKVSNTGYFVYVNGRKDLEAFDGKLEFYVDIIPYSGSDEWVGIADRSSRMFRK